MASQNDPSPIKLEENYHIENLKEFREDFINYMSDMPTFISKAIEVELLTYQDKTQILSSQNNAIDQIREMLAIIGKKLPEKSKKFLYSLYRSGNDYLAELLLQGKPFDCINLRKDPEICNESLGFGIFTQGGEVYYSMKNRGRVVIIENVNFRDPGCSTRDGSERDRKALVNFFTKLNFDVVLKQDLTAKEMEDFLHYQIYNQKGSKEDCFILLILSHGRLSEIFGVDGKTMNYSVIFEKFNNSPIWKNQEKPKLIYIQACQPFFTEEETTEEKRHAQNNVGSYIYPGGHFYVMYATIPGKNAMRNTQTGSILVTCLMKVYEEKYLTEDVETMGVKVKQLVYRDSDKIQIAVSYSCLTTGLFLGSD